MLKFRYVPALFLVSLIAKTGYAVPATGYETLWKIEKIIKELPREVEEPFFEELKPGDPRIPESFSQFDRVFQLGELIITSPTETYFRTRDESLAYAKKLGAKVRLPSTSELISFHKAVRNLDTNLEVPGGQGSLYTAEPMRVFYENRLSYRDFKHLPPKRARFVFDPSVPDTFWEICQEWFCVDRGTKVSPGGEIPMATSGDEN